MLLNKLNDILQDFETEAASRGDENTLALINRVRTMFSHLTAYAENPAFVTHANLEGTYVPANMVNQTPFRDTASTVQAYQQGNVEREELKGLDARNDLDDGEKTRQRYLQEKHGTAGSQFEIRGI